MCVFEVHSCVTGSGERDTQSQAEIEVERKRLETDER